MVYFETHYLRTVIPACARMTVIKSANKDII
jgi:hypothetical protein